MPSLLECEAKDNETCQHKWSAYRDRHESEFWLQLLLLTPVRQ